MLEDGIAWQIAALHPVGPQFSPVTKMLPGIDFETVVVPVIPFQLFFIMHNINYDIHTYLLPSRAEVCMGDGAGVGEDTCSSPARPPSPTSHHSSAD